MEGVAVSSWLDIPAAPTFIQEQVRKDLKGQGQGGGGGGGVSVQRRAVCVCVCGSSAVHPRLAG